MLLKFFILLLISTSIYAVEQNNTANKSKHFQNVPVKTNGFILNGIEPGSMFDKLGIKAGDMVHKIK